MDQLPTFTVGYLFLFCDVKSAHNLSRTCKEMKTCLDVNIRLLDDDSRSKLYPKIIKNKSLGLTYLTIRDINEKGCVSCGLSKRICGASLHPFFGVTICKRCRVKMDVFKIGGLKSLCKKHFISEKDARASKRIRIKKGKRIERVLESDILYISDEVVGKFNRNKLNLRRESRSLLIYQNRLSSVTSRENETRKRFYFGVEQYTNYAISDFFRDFDLILTLCPLVCKSILYDFFEHRVNVKQKITCVVSGMLRVCRMFTALDRYKLLIPNKLFEISKELGEYISIIQLYNRENYEVVIPQYFRSLRSFRTKSEEMSFRYNRDPENSTEYDRFEIAEYACEEDEVEFNEDVFEDFIMSNVGNPFIIARSIKKMNYLLDNGYNEILMETNSTWMARVETLRWTMGYCPM